MPPIRWEQHPPCRRLHNFIGAAYDGFGSLPYRPTSLGAVSLVDTKNYQLFFMKTPVKPSLSKQYLCNWGGGYMNTFTSIKVNSWCGILIPAFCSAVAFWFYYSVFPNVVSCAKLDKYALFLSKWLTEMLPEQSQRQSPVGTH